MKLIIYKDRTIKVFGIYGTQNENGAEEIELQVPEILQDKDCEMWVLDKEQNLSCYTIENLKFTLNEEITNNEEVYIYFTFTKNDFKFITKTIKATFFENVSFLDSLSTGEYYDYLYKLKNLDNILSSSQVTVDEIIANSQVYEQNENQRIINEKERGINEEQRQQNEETRNQNMDNFQQLYDKVIYKLENGEFIGNCNFATFELDRETGELIMWKPEEMTQIDFAINENGELEVITNV